MSWAHIQSTGIAADAGATTAVKAYASNITVGSLLLCFLGWYSASGEDISTVTDSLGQTWTKIGATVTGSLGGGNWSCAMFYFKNSAAGANTVTATFSVSTQYRSLSISEYSGIETSTPLDQTTSNIQLTPGTGTDAVTSGSVTTTTNNELVYGGSISILGVVSFVSGTGFSQRDYRNTTFSQSVIEDKNLATSGSTAATFTNGSVISNNASIIATFKEPAAGPANIKTINGLVLASIKICNGLSVALIKTRNGLN